MKIKQWNYEHFLYALALFLALAVRFYRLGAPALTDFEAGWANQALSIARGQPVVLGPQPLFILLTSLFFNIFGSTNFSARLLPALAGAALVLFPVFFRQRLGRSVTLVATFGLALDPLLVATSRIAGEGMPAVAFTLLAVGAFFASMPALAGVLAGLALLCGPSLLPGILGLALTWGVIRLLDVFGLVSLSARPENLEPSTDKPVIKFLPLFLLAGIVLLFGTLFFRYPQGLSALGGTLPAYLEGWGRSSGIPLLRLLAALVIYQPLATIFGTVTLMRSWRRAAERLTLGREFGVWALIVLLLLLVYPSRQVSDLAWVLTPLWMLAASEIVRNLFSEVDVHTRRVSLGQALLIVLLTVFSWFNLLGFSQGVVLTRFIKVNSAIVLLGVFFMIGITILLVSLGWSWGVARRGLAWAMLTVLGIFLLSGVCGGTRLGQGDRQELWERQPAIQEADLLQKTLHDLSEWVTGQGNTLDMVVLVDSPSLRWLLRNWQGTRFSSTLTEGDLPAVIIAYKDQETPRLSEIYRGQDFAWGIYSGWDGVVPTDFFRWLAFRKAPVQSTQIILWARGDIFPSSEFNPLDNSTPNP